MNQSQHFTSSNKQPASASTAMVPPLINPPKIESNVIKIIQREWDKEVERLDAKKNGYKQKSSNVGDKSLVQSGHAEIESNRILYIFGNALEVLQRSEFYDQVEEMHLTYVRFDLIVYHQNLDKLKKFTKLKKIIFSHNYLNSFILLSKIEVITTHSLTLIVRRLAPTTHHLRQRGPQLQEPQELHRLQIPTHQRGNPHLLYSI